MSRSCGDIRTELIDCVRESECLKTGLRDFHKCIKSPTELDKECVVLRQGYGDCRRGWMDNRQRMSGNQPGKTESTVQQDRLDQVAGKRKQEKSCRLGWPQSLCASHSLIEISILLVFLAAGVQILCW